MPAIRPIRFLVAALFAVIVLLLALEATRTQAQSIDEEKYGQGARLYQENCAVCHGQNGEGRVGATLAQDWPSIRPSAAVETVIRQGVEGSVMPAWSQEAGGPFNDEQIDALVYFILSWQEGGPERQNPTPLPRTPLPPIEPVPEVEGDPNQGAVLFAENCAVCHGENGEGRVGATLAQNWPGIRPDLNIKTTISQGVEGSLMPAWSQANGGPLAEEQIDNLVAFILSREGVEQVSGEQEPVNTPVIPWLSGWGGVLLAFGLFTVLVALALIAQRR